jgi:hypothetical protein
MLLLSLCLALLAPPSGRQPLTHREAVEAERRALRAGAAAWRAWEARPHLVRYNGHDSRQLPARLQVKRFNKRPRTAFHLLIPIE